MDPDAKDDRAGLIAGESNERLHALTAAKVTSFLERNGIEKSSSQAHWLEDVLNISYSAAARKLKGESSWLDSDLYRVANAMHRSMAEIFGGDERLWLPVFVQIADQVVEGRAILADSVPVATGNTLVAIETASGNYATTLSDAGEQKLLGYIERLEFGPHGGVSIAILDDDSSIGQSIKQVLDGKDIKVHLFEDAETLIRDPRRFDAYILDWWLGKKRTSESAIRDIRAKHGADPIIYMITGELVSGLVDEGYISRIAAEFDVKFQQKPVRCLILKSEIIRNSRFEGGFR